MLKSNKIEGCASGEVAPISEIDIVADRLKQSDRASLERKIWNLLESNYYCENDRRSFLCAFTYGDNHHQHIAKIKLMPSVWSQVVSLCS